MLTGNCGQDCSLRFWPIPEQYSMLAFRMHPSSPVHRHILLYNCLFLIALKRHHVMVHHLSHTSERTLQVCRDINLWPYAWHNATVPCLYNENWHTLVPGFFMPWPWMSRENIALHFGFAGLSLLRYYYLAHFTAARSDRATTDLGAAPHISQPHVRDKRVLLPFCTKGELMNDCSK